MQKYTILLMFFYKPSFCQEQNKGSGSLLLYLFQISDFGCAFDKQNSDQIEIAGITYPYAAPEWIAPINGFLPTFKCDIYR